MAAVERAVFGGQIARQRPLLAERVAGPSLDEIVAADRNADAGDVERLWNELVVVDHPQAEAVAVLELDRELAVDIARLQPAGAVFDVIDRSDPGELPDRRDSRRPRAEPELGVAAPHVVAADEPHFGIEIGAD